MMGSGAHRPTLELPQTINHLISIDVYYGYTGPQWHFGSPGIAVS